MKRLILSLLFVLPVLSAPAFAATEQQNKMSSCNKDAGDKKGDERKAFMKQCLSKQPEKPKASEAQQAQRDKMKTCSAQGKGKKGDDYKNFMSQCLKKS